jgi:hypothetical protein
LRLAFSAVLDAVGGCLRDQVPDSTTNAPAHALAGVFLDGECRSTPIRLDFIFRLRTGLTPSPTNDCKKASLAPPSRSPITGGHHDQSRRYSDVLLRQRVLCGSCGRGHNFACLSRANTTGTLSDEQTLTSGAANSATVRLALTSRRGRAGSQAANPFNVVANLPAAKFLLGHPGCR